MVQRYYGGHVNDLLRLKPTQNLEFTAIEKLSTKNDINDFFDGFVDYLRDAGETAKIRQDPVSSAKEKLTQAYKIVSYTNHDVKNTAWPKILGIRNDTNILLRQTGADIASL
jgi:hypothetical protein